MGRGWRGQVTVEKERSMGAVTTPLAATALSPSCTLCLLPRPLSPGSPVCRFEGHTPSPLWEGTAVPCGHFSCICHLLWPSGTDIPKGRFALKGSRWCRAPTPCRFAMPLQVRVKRLSWGSCLRVRAAAQDEPIILPSFITG